MDTRTPLLRRLRLLALLLALFGWFALPGAAPARADDDNSPVSIDLEELKKREDLRPNQEQVFTFRSQVNSQVLIGTLNLDREDDPSRRTAPRVTVSCPGLDGASSGAPIPANGQSIVSSGVSSSAVFCTPTGEAGETHLVDVSVTVKNTNNRKIDTYAVFAIQLKAATEFILPDTNNNLKLLNFAARKVALYRLPEQQAVDRVNFLLQYRGEDSRAYAFIYRDTDASAACTATQWWDKSGSSAPSSFSSCDLNDGNTTANNNYLVILNTKNKCIRYRVYLASSISTGNLNGNNACSPVS